VGLSFHAPCSNGYYLHLEPRQTVGRGVGMREESEREMEMMRKDAWEGREKWETCAERSALFPPTPSSSLHPSLSADAINGDSVELPTGRS
jgi:hypothetical protein